jgi:hypothetical protein
MTFTNILNKFPKSLKFIKKENVINLIISGQGVFIFENQDPTKNCSFKILNNDETNGLKIEFTSTSVLVNDISTQDTFIDTDNNQGLSNKNGAYYWFSLDAQNQKLYAGIGEARTDTIIYAYQFDQTKEIKSFLESLVTIVISKSSSINPIKLLRDPVTNDTPLLVKNTDELSMDDIAKNTYLPNAFLSQSSQQLYNCISGKNFILNSNDFPDFSNAIEYSIKTPGCWCYETLKSKSTEFNPDKPNILETYLRITLGQNNGESPGVPYVMEIWPPQHYSPVHNHGGSNAIIRVLNGNITVSLFPYLSTDNIDAFAKQDFSSGDITWINPNLNQVHQLKNNNENTCITIQCYMYGQDDTIHYDYFDYIDDDGKKQQFEPDSDMDYVKFKETIRQEWNNRPTEIIKNNQSFWDYFRSFFCLN